jgi:hypothetical protein
MGTQILCPWCKTHYDPSERYLAHKPARCEAIALREHIERLKIALHHWMPDESMVEAAESHAWNEHIELLRRTV